MPNFTTLLKSEISRIARKESRAETIALKKAAATHRTEIAALKRRLQELEKLTRTLGRQMPKERAAPTEDADGESGVRRFSAKGFASQRERLGLSAAQCGLLIGASGQTIYNWEAGKAKPRGKHLPAIAEFRALGKTAALARLEALDAKG